MDAALTLLSFGPDGWGDDIATGVLVTVGLALATLPFGLVLGFFVALMKQSEEPSMRLAGNIYTTIFRGLPELLTLFLIFYGAQLGLQQITALFGEETTIEINAFAAGMVALGIMFSSYASEVFLAAFRVIPRGQYEGAYAVGLSHTRTMRLVILPQLIRVALPGLGNLWLILLKDTALVSVIGLSDILRQTGVAARVTKEPFLFFGLACLLYLVLAVLSSFVFSAIERWAAKSGGTR
ncbi:ABC transporter permease [Tianweitania populi]|uniref:ABC transporter permease n=1 Tax=Tianweitania populi TaxID=1607949 RepID=A0A8J3DXI2_9HYPH|nr:ABC transporter permease [Tianweitania populi]GHD10184.1 ABC transporter permease [Tianweitania populi]